jgi:hypothetical protein
MVCLCGFYLIKFTLKRNKILNCISVRNYFYVLSCTLLINKLITINYNHNIYPIPYTQYSQSIHMNNIM